MAVGEAGCASVHGANRLGSNSLIDLVVFGRAAAIRAARLWILDSVPTPEPSVCRCGFDRFDGLRYAKGHRRLRSCALRCRKTMQDDAAVFRTDKTLNEGVRR